MLIACHGNIGPVISQAEGLAVPCFSLSVRESMEPACQPQKKKETVFVVKENPFWESVRTVIVLQWQFVTQLCWQNVDREAAQAKL